MSEHIHQSGNHLPESNKRVITPEQISKFEGYAAEILTALGMDLNTDSTRETPARFIKALMDSTEGYEGDPKLVKVFTTECRGGPDCRISQIIEGPIAFFALCEHHGLPFYGFVYIAYISHEHIIGISKLTRLVHIYSRRFSVQERIGQQIADTLELLLQPHGVAVYIEARHLCVEMRGVKEMAPVTRTTYWRGNYETDPQLRNEFLMACSMKMNR